MQNPCLRCGACCAHYRVSFYWGEADPEQGGMVPPDLVQGIDGFRRCMNGTNQSNPCCIALQGEIGQEVHCTIYENRPTPATRHGRRVVCRRSTSPCSGRGAAGRAAIRDQQRASEAPRRCALVSLRRKAHDQFVVLTVAGVGEKGRSIGIAIEKTGQQYWQIFDQRQPVDPVTRHPFQGAFV
jgi:hypothetical protein